MASDVLVRRLVAQDSEIQPRIKCPSFVPLKPRLRRDARREREKRRRTRKGQAPPPAAPTPPRRYPLCRGGTGAPRAAFPAARGITYSACRTSRPRLSLAVTAAAKGCLPIPLTDEQIPCAAASAACCQALCQPHCPAKVKGAPVALVPGERRRGRPAGVPDGVTRGRAVPSYVASSSYVPGVNPRRAVHCRQIEKAPWSSRLPIKRRTHSPPFASHCSGCWSTLR